MVSLNKILKKGVNPDFGYPTLKKSNKSKKKVVISETTEDIPEIEIIESDEEEQDEDEEQEENNKEDENMDDVKSTSIMTVRRTLNWIRANVLPCQQ
ncbi:hypothetical protein TWF481_002738 [Arthrobotrys musiformis]|uniref:Uncharacterized protein n=1 Tax=Arthrobotrys musiformis TaxID=47236 RepID=A0AAV9VR71_9PEZI